MRSSNAVPVPELAAGRRELIPRLPARASSIGRTGAWLALGLLPSCLGPRSDHHLAPFFTEISTAGGGTRVEMLGGALIGRRPRPDADFDQYGLRPFFIHDTLSRGTSRTDFLTPFGAVVRRPGELKWRLTPLMRYDRIEYPDGTRKWTFISLFGLYLAGFPDGRTVRGWFPFGGVSENLLTFDRLEWVLWPIYMKTIKGDITTYSVLWPFFAYSPSEGVKKFRIWPLIGQKSIEGINDRAFMLWPFFMVDRSNLKASPEYHRETVWAWPFYAGVKQGSFRATSVLWPFFGYSRDPRSGFYALDAPWPLVRLQVPGTSIAAKRKRFWPIWSSFEGERLRSYWWVWPIVNKRHARYPDGQRESFFVLPFWRSFDRQWTYGTELQWRKLWPLYQQETFEGRTMRSFPALNPLWRTPGMDRMYGWLWELYNDETGEGVVRERALWGIYRREKDPDEDRRYVTGIWSSRLYTAQGRRIRETSLLFGLIRWRTGDGLRLLHPAFPGPGWPHERVPSSSGEEVEVRDEIPRGSDAILEDL